MLSCEFFKVFKEHLFGGTSANVEVTYMQVFITRDFW